MPAQLSGSLRISLANAAVQHRARIRRLERSRSRSRELLQRRTRNPDHEPRFGAELTNPKRGRINQTRSNRTTSNRQRFRQQEHRIRTTHLREHRNRNRPRSRSRHQRLSTATRARKRNRLDRRMTNQSLTHSIPTTNQQREHTFRQSAIRNRLLDHSPNQLRSPRMRMMRLSHHRTSSRKRRSSITTSNRESERKVTSPKHRNRTNRNLPRPNIRPRSRLPIRQRRIDRHIQPSTFANDRSKQPQLPTVLPRSPSIRGRGRPDSAITRSTSSSPRSRIPCAIASSNCARVSSGAARNASNARSSQRAGLVHIANLRATKRRLHHLACSRVGSTSRAIKATSAARSNQ